jgi:hypothetical protein
MTILTAMGLAILSQAAAAQQIDKPWKPTARVQGDVRYDNNPFLLTANQKDNLRVGSSADVASGRFRDMPGAVDAIAVTALEVGAAGPGLVGRTLAISGEAVYEANAQNDRRRHAELTFGIEQALPHAGRVRLRADWRPSYFWKNYLSDATDVSGDGNISDDERVYEPATSHEVDLTLNYRQRLVKGVRSELELGYFARGYDAPFAGRDRSGPGAAAGLVADVGAGWTLGLEYGYQSLQADVTREVQILDETEFGVDFNGTNGVADTAARAFELVDRSRTEQNMRVSLETQLSAGNGTTLQLAFARRTRAFSSTQPFDVSDRGRHDARNEIEAELTVRLAHGLRLTLGGAAARQTTNRPGDPGSTGDVTDYSRRVVTAGIAYRF